MLISVLVFWASFASISVFRLEVFRLEIARTARLAGFVLTFPTGYRFSKGVYGAIASRALCALTRSFLLLKRSLRAFLASISAFHLEIARTARLAGFFLIYPAGYRFSID